MKIVCISDTHEKHRAASLPRGDILLHAGDMTWSGDEKATLDFLEWFEGQPFRHKVFIAGNHDFYFENAKKTTPLIKGGGFHYLFNQSVAIEEIKIWGSPFTPEFMDWAFMGTPSQLDQIWAQIPEGLDILITHGPPFGIMDETMQGHHAGCPSLLKAVSFKKPKFHVFGHIHEGHGILKKNETTFINAALCDASYALVNAPVTVEI